MKLLLLLLESWLLAGMAADGSGSVGLVVLLFFVDLARLFLVGVVARRLVVLPLAACCAFGTTNF